MNELESIQLDIDSLLEANRLDWLELATTPMEPTRRLALKQAIAARSIKLFDLLERKWVLTPHRT
jgi:hypothetical protein